MDNFLFQQDLSTIKVKKVDKIGLSYNVYLFYKVIHIFSFFIRTIHIFIKFFTIYVENIYHLIFYHIWFIMFLSEIFTFFQFINIYYNKEVLYGIHKRKLELNKRNN